MVVLGGLVSLGSESEVWVCCETRVRVCTCGVLVRSAE